MGDKIMETLRKKIVNELIEKGVPLYMDGFRYWIDAVEIFMKNDKLKMGEIFKMIAKKNNSMPTRVERSLRNAIKHIETSTKKFLFLIAYSVDEEFF